MNFKADLYIVSSGLLVLLLACNPVYSIYRRCRQLAEAQLWRGRVPRLLSASVSHPIIYSSPSSDWFHSVGWALTLVSLVQIPLWMIIVVLTAAFQGDVMKAFRPSLVCYGPLGGIDSLTISHPQEWQDRRDQREVEMVKNISILASSQTQIVGMNDRQDGSVSLRGFNFY